MCELQIPTGISRQEIFVMGLNTPETTASQNGIRYSVKLINVLKQFSTSLSVKTAPNPVKEHYGTAYQHLVTGDRYRFNQEWDTAIQYYQKGLALCTDLPDALQGIATCYRRKGCYPEAITVLKEILKQNYFCVKTHLDIANCYTETGKSSLAMRHYKKALQLDAHSIEGLFGLALLQESQQDYQTAIQSYQTIIHLQPDFVPAYNNLGSVYIKSAQYPLAEELFRQLTEKAPGFYRGHLGLAIVLDKSGQHRQALLKYQTILNERPAGYNACFIQARIAELSRFLKSSGHVFVGQARLSRVK
jgi:tetratricopeptide (TPR) repeat protein